ncbi:MAG: hypothetical protein EOL87_18545 [Spartobacteria bacterium]|nr:hypothetical protein [Spartobacteria bacterium]
MALIYGILTALCVSIALPLLCLPVVGVAHVIYALKGSTRAIRLQSNAARHARVFEVDLLDAYVSQLKGKTASTNETAKAEILQRFAATDQRFVDGLLQMTMRMVESVRIMTVEKDVESEVNLVFFKLGRNADVKQITVAGMPVGHMFKVTKKSKVTVRTDKLAETATKLYTGNIPGAVLSALPESNKLIADGGVE